MKSILSLIVLTSVISFIVHGQQVIPLYVNAIPNSKPAPGEEKESKDQNGFDIISKISNPTLTIYLPAKNRANGAAVIIFPGGGYYVKAIKHEGTEVAQWFNR